MSSTASDTASFDILPFSRSTVLLDTHRPMLLSVDTTQELVPSILQNNPIKSGSMFVDWFCAKVSIEIDINTAYSSISRLSLTIIHDSEDGTYKHRISCKTLKFHIFSIVSLVFLHHRYLDCHPNLTLHLLLQVPFPWLLLAGTTYLVMMQIFPRLST